MLKYKMSSEAIFVKFLLIASSANWAYRRVTRTTVSDFPASADQFPVLFEIIPCSE
jgi:hypothetical protein